MTFFRSELRLDKVEACLKSVMRKPATHTRAQTHLTITRVSEFKRMDSERLKQIEATYHAALELPPAGREAFCKDVCGADENLRREVESLLSFENTSGNFLDTPPAALAAEIFAAREKQPSLINQEISHYRVKKLLGKGGMGEVYLAEDTELGRRVALKVLPAELTKNKAGLQRFEREAQAASSLNHPNILTVYEISAEDGLHFIATEFIDGESLRQHIERTRLELRAVLDIGIQVAAALAAAHQAGVIHRDIKPENIMLRADGYVKVLDFGLAKLADQTTAAQRETADAEALTRVLLHTAPGMVMGTTPYMSPEQARGQKVDARADVWSLGVVLYEMLTRRTPFAGETTSDVIAAILKTEAAPPTSFNAEIPSELERIVLKTLRKDCDQRYQHIKDLLIDLKDLKQELEFAAKLERSVPPDTRSQRELRPTVATNAVLTSGASDIHTTSSAEYFVNEIKQHKLGATVALVALVGVIAIGFLASARYLVSSDQAGIASLAILPFTNATGDPNTEYLSDGISESLINNLSQLSGMKVIARSSAFKYKGKETDPQEVARALGVDTILTGRVLQRGESLQISVELMDARDNTQVWGAQYNRKAADVLTLQAEIVQEIAEKLRRRLQLTATEQQQLAKRYTDNTEAYQLYIKGRYYWNKRTSEALKQSVEYFNQAIEKDPNYALAYVGLADAYNVLPFFSAGSSQEYFPKAKAAAQRALEMDESLAEAHTALASVLVNYDWNLPESNKEFRRAIELKPNYATAHHWYAIFNLQIMGRFDEAISEMERAQELDPLSSIINANLGKTYFNARRYDQAIEQWRKTIDMDPGFFVTHHYLGSAYAMKGSHQEALAEYQKARQLNNDDPHVLALIGRLLAVSGQKAEALKTLGQLKEISQRRYVPAYSIALVYAGLNEKEQALNWLDKGYQARAVDMTYLNYDPLLDNLRSDPRFVDLLRRVGLTPSSM